MVIPFFEHRQFSKKAGARLSDIGFPGWAKTSDGRALRVMLAEGRAREAEDYCKEHARAPFAMSKKSVVLYDHYDAATVRMMFGA